jgi:hypothetical protein
VEIDLYVPEYIERNAKIRREPWYPRYQRLARAGQPALVERAPGSFILIFARSPAQRPGGTRR